MTTSAAPAPTTSTPARTAAATTGSALLLRRSRAEEVRGSVFCAHGAGGGCLFFMPVARRISGEHDVYGFQAHGMDHTVAPDTTLAEMAARYAADLRAADPVGPYKLLGYSMGGIIAHEVARILLAQGARVELVGLLDTLFPAPAVRRPREATLTLCSIALALPEQYHAAEGLTWDEQCDRFLAHAQASGSLPQGFDRARLERMVDLYDINQDAVAGHEPAELPVPLHILLTADGSARHDVDRWKATAAEGTVVDTIDADHFKLMSEAHAAEVAEIVTRWLSAAAA
ncbi:alpha/beta fold hydrolase [Streptomyces sp. NPDC090025]|uniref:thioesterase domain-containing protein n=1 Tax=Streptomyces sp. NPDC090025 TaxID=3365922 RepID=UPI003835B0D5